MADRGWAGGVGLPAGAPLCYNLSHSSHGPRGGLGKVISIYDILSHFPFLILFHEKVLVYAFSFPTPIAQYCNGNKISAGLVSPNDANAMR